MIFLGVRKSNNSERSTQQIIVMPGDQALSLKTHPLRSNTTRISRALDTLGADRNGRRLTFARSIH
jgi:hypothetical protein